MDEAVVDNADTSDAVGDAPDGPTDMADSIADMPGSAIDFDNFADMPSSAVDAEGVADIPGSAVVADGIASMPGIAVDADNVADMPGSAVDADPAIHRWRRRASNQPVVLRIFSRLLFRRRAGRISADIIASIEK